ncbi:N-acetylmuramoyl-L-alanine amidase family protein [Sediminicola sp. 1XM1-17]|uniref:N-acetylmuramoyl-L-alanine amidase family protein n=1 Tax=Sediminicola sp. 1XM1-17 TaxID=3127702 RepID=UPI00307738CA
MVKYIVGKRFCAVAFIVLAFLLSSFSVPGDKKPKEKTFVVVLDAGHGGHDPGNLGNGYLEKNIALNIVLNVGKMLEKNPNVKVVYTRKDDTFVDLYVRGQIANKADADLFVSVHCDSHNSDAHGAGTFVLGLHANKQNFEIAKKENSAIYLEDDYETRYAGYDINSPESIIGMTIMQEEFLDQSIALAKLIQDNFTGKLKRVDRKVKQAGFIVLHQTFMPSVLVETGFLTNKSEGAYLNSSRGQTEMGTAIASAILDYKNSRNGNMTLDYVKKESPSAASVAKEAVKKESPKEEMVRVKQVVTPTAKEKETPKETVVKTKESKPESKEEGVDPIEFKKKSNLVFKVQLFASSKVVPLESENFKGLNKLSKEPVGNLFRYMYGNAENYFDAKLLKSNADAKGYTTSYVVAYKDGKRISLEDAMKYVSE